MPDIILKKKLISGLRINSLDRYLKKRLVDENMAEITINKIDNQLKKLIGANKKIEYLEGLIHYKNSLSPEVLVHVYRSAQDVYSANPSPPGTTYLTNSDRAYIHGIDATKVPEMVKHYKNFDEHKKEWIQKSQETIKKIHRYNPEYVFLTETSSIPSGYILKEALRKAYPDSLLPKFYRVDPRQVRQVMSEGDSKNKRKLEKFFKKRIKNKDANILVYDMDWDDGWSPGSIVALLKHPERFGFNEDITCANVKMNSRTFPENARKLNPDVKKEYGLEDSDVSSIIAIEAHFLWFSRLTIKGNSYPKTVIKDFRAQIRKKEDYPSGNDRNYDPRYRSPSELIEGAKKLGGELGEQLRSRIEQQKGLEQKVSAGVMAFGILGSLFFSSLNVSGNVIGNLTNSSNSLIGIGLFILGLVGAIFLFRKK